LVAAIKEKSAPSLWTESVRCPTMGSFLRPENHEMSLADYASRPFPVFSKLAVVLRNSPAVQFVLARFAALLSADKASGESLISRFRGEVRVITGTKVDRHLAVLERAGDFAIAAPKTNDQSGREQLIRRRWAETGIKMWNPAHHGAGHAALNIQGRAELLPVKPGETMPGYDKLEFKLMAGRIVCEGVVVDPPKRRK
jgi:hypothetical protein